MFDLARSRASEREQLRIADLMSLTPPGDRVLEIGARDCYLSRRLSDLYREVVALDLQRPVVDHPGIVPVQGDVTDLRFGDGTFDTVFCTEVLEHVPPEKLVRACDEIERTTSRYAVIGVPYRQTGHCAVAAARSIPLRAISIGSTAGVWRPCFPG